MGSKSKGYYYVLDCFENEDRKDDVCINLSYRFKKNE